MSLFRYIIVVRRYRFVFSTLSQPWKLARSCYFHNSAIIVHPSLLFGVFSQKTKPMVQRSTTSMVILFFSPFVRIFVMTRDAQNIAISSSKAYTNIRTWIEEVEHDSYLIFTRLFWICAICKLRNTWNIYNTIHTLKKNAIVRNY